MIYFNMKKNVKDLELKMTVLETLDGTLNTLYEGNVKIIGNPKI